MTLFFAVGLNYVYNISLLEKFKDKSPSFLVPLSSHNEIILCASPQSWEKSRQKDRPKYNLEPPHIRGCNNA